MLQESFGIQVKERRESKGMSQSELAKLAGLERSQISRIEKGNLNITLETVEKLCCAFNTSINDLLIYNNNKQPKPFVKWAGGKTQILEQLKEYIPEKYNDYFEPFVGGGALLFSVMPKQAYINDINYELICAYKCFQNDELYKKMIRKIKNYENKHNEHNFILIRNMDRTKRFKKLTISTIAARFVYLNKACFNGLYRVNSQGFFNVPSAKRENVNAYNKENFELIKDYFLTSTINVFNMDFEEFLKKTNKEDFVYFDPPYDVFPDKNGFVNYGKDGFSKNDQIRLCKCFKELDKKGAKLMLSNHNTPFINELYKNYNIHIINARRSINANGSGRGNVEEVIITNYE